MPTKIRLSWDKSNSCWTKTINKQRYRLGGGKSKSDMKSYREAYSKYKQLLVDLQETTPEPEVPLHKRPSKDELHKIMKVSYYIKRGGDGCRDANTMLGQIDRFVEDLQLQIDNKKLSANRVGDIVRSMNDPTIGWIKFLGRTKVGKPGSNEMLIKDKYARQLLDRYHTELGKRIVRRDKKHMSPYTTNIFYSSVKKFYYFMAKREQLGDYGLPFAYTDLDYWEVGKSPRKDDLFTIEEIRTLYQCSYGYNSKLWTITLRSIILLGANCAFGPMDCATLTHQEVDLEEGRIRRFREKSRQWAEHKLWPETIDYLRQYIALDRGQPLMYADWFGALIEKKQDHTLVFKSQQNYPLRHFNFDKGIKTNVDSINQRFANLKRKYLPKDHHRRGYKVIRKVSASELDKMKQFADRGRLISMFLSHMHRGSIAYKSYVAPDYSELDEAIMQLREVYKFYDIVDKPRPKYKVYLRSTEYHSIRPHSKKKIW